MRKLLEITLQSDLCAGVGKHFAAMIDLDTALDEFGIPFIPSRRLKGCLRESAEYIGVGAETLDAIFGKTGDCKAGSLRIANACIADYAESVDAMTAGEAEAAEVTELFCSVRGETAIDEETGTAKDQSLRYIRVVNRTAPGSDEPMKFFASLEYGDEFENDMQRIVDALRNIGYHRNRGLGAVTCRLTDDDSNVAFDDVTLEDGKSYEIRYTVRLDSDMMLPASDANHTMDYIPGTVVLGAFAAGYVAKHGDSDFNRIFYADDVRFGNLYPAQPLEKGFACYKPAYRFLAKIKSGNAEERGVYNLTCVNENETREDGSLRQYKPLKKGYIHPDYGFTEPERKIVYHNALNAEDGGLYMQHCLCAGQYFSGMLTGSGAKLAPLYNLLKDGVVRFGRSKTAQYAKCTVCEIVPRECEETALTAAQGSVAAYVFESDAVLCDANGIFVTDLESAAAALGVNADSLCDQTSIATKTISGYNAKWNHKKPQFPVIAAGSCIIFRTEESLTAPEYRLIGEKLNEGFGCVRFIPDVTAIAVGNKSIPKAADSNSPIHHLLENKRLEHDLAQKAVARFHEIRLESTQVGRIILMCKEAKDVDDFIRRVDSIKTASIHDEAMRSMQALISYAGENVPWKKEQHYIIQALTLKKYELRKEKKNG